MRVNIGGELSDPTKKSAKQSPAAWDCTMHVCMLYKKVTDGAYINMYVRTYVRIYERVDVDVYICISYYVYIVYDLVYVYVRLHRYICM